MKMNTYTHKPGPVSIALLGTVEFVGIELHEVPEQHTAELIIVTGTDDLRGVYNEKQLFCVLATTEREKSIKQPENVCILDIGGLFKKDGGLVKLGEMIRKRQEMAGGDTVKTDDIQMPSGVVRFNTVYKVLVIDDKKENRRLAELVLSGHTVVTAEGVKEAVEIMKSQRFDAVLTDMEMKPDKQFGSLDISRYGVTETVDYGFPVMFIATGFGIPVAIVTDGNHHQSLVSAMFDDITEAYVNGQKVLFFNSIGKRWDLALKSLLEP